MKGRGIPGTTPLVAIALIDIAVNNVYKETERQTDFSTFLAFLFVSRPVRLLT